MPVQRRSCGHYDANHRDRMCSHSLPVMMGKLAPPHRLLPRQWRLSVPLIPAKDTVGLRHSAAADAGESIQDVRGVIYQGAEHLALDVESLG